MCEVLSILNVLKHFKLIHITTLTSRLRFSHTVKAKHSGSKPADVPVPREGVGSDRHFCSSPCFLLCTNNSLGAQQKNSCLKFVLDISS